MSSNFSHTERELLALAGNSDQLAFAELFDRNKYKLFGFMFRLTGSMQMTEDVVQDVFLRLWKDREKLPLVQNFNAYLFQMSRNEAIDAFRRMARERIALQKVAELNDNSSHHFNPVEEKELKQQIEKVLDQLPKQQNLVYRLSREHGMKHEDIARHLNISPGTVKNHMVQALSTLRRHLERYRSIIAKARGFWPFFLFSSLC